MVRIKSHDRYDGKKRKEKYYLMLELVVEVSDAGAFSLSGQIALLKSLNPRLLIVPLRFQLKKTFLLYDIRARHTYMDPNQHNVLCKTLNKI